MIVQGTHEFAVNIQQLWNYLMDPVVLAKITPGISQLEPLGDDKFKSISKIKIGPVKSSFTGNMAVIDKIEPTSFTIQMEQLSKIGNAQVKVDMQLSEQGENKTLLAFDGKADLSGVIARTGQRVLSGVANVITKEVFSALEAHIAEEVVS